MNIGKLITIFISLVTISASVWIYFEQKENRKIQTSEVSKTKARLLGYDLYRYQKDVLKTRISGRKAKINDDGLLICEDKVKAVRIRDGVREELETKTAEIKFTNNAIMSEKNNTVDTIQLSQGVELIRGNSRFQTEDLFYKEQTGEATTEKPVRIETDGQFVAAEGGMNYNIKSESIRLEGGVFGTLRSDAMESGLKGKKKDAK